ncbi:MAG: hypothetical protein ACRDY7_08585, partial [Acidimicrobiia bacterium]
MHVTFIVEGDERELDVDPGQGEATVADLLGALTGGATAGDGRTGLIVDGRFWPADAPLADLA